MDNISPEEWLDIQSECEDLVEVYLEDNILLVSEISFFPTLIGDVHNFMVLNGIQQGWCVEDDADELFEIVTEFCTHHLKCMGVPFREHSPYRIYEYKENEVKNTIEWLNRFPIQRQRTVEWYATRRQLFSASNLWKLFGTPSQYNSLIYEKCKEVKIMDSQFEGDILSPNARNWGIKYEPISVLVYEHKYNTTINNKYGCIPHETYPIGASPDGINVKENHPKYGHLLEIKNIYNREMSGIPSKEYWIQMQIQMETCRLEYCDFLETRFKEYSKEEYEEDLTSEYKGIVLFFIPREHAAVQSEFIYVPLFTLDTDAWIETKILEKMESHILYLRTYWYLDEMFCTEIERNDLWFRSSVPQMIDGWETVLKERISGFEHRSPQSRKKKANAFELAVTIVKLD